MGYGFKLNSSKSGSTFLNNWIRKITAKAITNVSENEAVRITNYIPDDGNIDVKTIDNPVNSNQVYNAWSPNGKYLAVSYGTIEYLAVYKNNNGTLTKLSVPATNGTVGRGCTWSPDNNYLIATHSNSPYITIYKRNGDTFTKLANPASLPAGNARGCDFSPDGNYLAIASEVSPYITIYKRNGDTFTKLANPATLPTSNGWDCVFSPDGEYLVVAHNTSPYITIYKRSGDTFTKLANPSSLPTNNGRGCAFTFDSKYLAIAHSTSPFVAIYKRDGDTFTKLANPATLPPGHAYGCNFSPDGNYFAIGSNVEPYMAIYKRNGDTFTKLANPSVLPNTAVYYFSFSPDGNYLAGGYNSTNYFILYELLKEVSSMDYKYYLPYSQVGYALATKNAGENVSVSLLKPINQLPPPAFYNVVGVPDPVTNFSTTLNTSNPSILVSWTNPTNNWARTTIIRKVGSAPTGISDGVMVYNGTGSSYTDSNISIKTTYYYRAFTYNKYNKYNDTNVSKGITLSGITMPTFTGTYTRYGNGFKGRVELTSSGTLTLDGTANAYDVCILDGGISGDYTYEAPECPAHGLCGVMYCVTPEEKEVSSEDSAGISLMSEGGITPYGVNTATAGRGGFISSVYSRSLYGAYTVSVASSDGSSSLYDSVTTINSGSGTVAYSGAGSGTNGSLGSGTTTKPFAGVFPEFYTPLSGGGSAASGTSGGYYGGGDYNSNGVANTGGGGGIPSTTSGTTSITRPGGSGKVIVRWGY